MIDLLNLTAKVVSAHLGNNRVPIEDVPKLIREVHRALATPGQAETAAPSGEPAVPIKSSVFPDRLVCLECGKPFSILKQHLANNHQLTPEQYRHKWGLPSSYPIVASDYAELRSALAKKIGLGRKPGARKSGRERRA